MGEGFVLMSREDALINIEKIEMKKAEFVAGIMCMAQIGQFPKEQLPLGQEMAKFQALDSLHEELGIQEGDIIIAFNNYQFADDEEFGAIIKKSQDATKARVQQGMQQIMAQQQAQARQ